jgi:hypothetical protein
MTYVPVDHVAELADRLALELGGVEACAYRENQYRDEERQWQEIRERQEDVQDPPNDILDCTLDRGDVRLDAETGLSAGSTYCSTNETDRPEESRERRRWEDEREMLRQMGLAHGLGLDP